MWLVSHRKGMPIMPIKPSISKPIDVNSYLQRENTTFVKNEEETTMAITNKNLAEAIKNILGSSTENVPTSCLGPFTEEDLIIAIEDGDYFTFVNIINAIVADDRVSKCITIDVSEAILNSENSSFLCYLETMNLSSSIRCHSVGWCMGNCPLQTFKEYLRVCMDDKISYKMLSDSLCFDNDKSKYVQEMYEAGDPESRIIDMKEAILKDDFEVFAHIAVNLSSDQLMLADIEDCESWTRVIELLIKEDKSYILRFILTRMMPFLSTDGNIIVHSFLASVITCKSYRCMQVLLHHAPLTDSEKISPEFVVLLFEKAIDTGELRYVEALVDAGFSVTTRVCSCYTPLFHAAARHHDDMVKYFIKVGVDISSFDSYSYHYSCGLGQFYKMIDTGNIEGFKILHENGGDWTVTTGSKSVFVYAAHSGKMEFIHCMMAGGYPLDNEIRGEALLELVMMSSLERDDEFETIDMLINEGANMNSHNLNNRTALHFACYWQNYDLVRTLCSAGANLLAVDDYGETPLECIDDASFKEEMKNFTVIPTPPDLPDLPTFKGYTPKKMDSMDDVPTTPKPFAAEPIAIEPEVEESEDMKTLRRLTRDLQDLQGLAAALRYQIENLHAMH